jgi:hypothetical protein
MSALVSLPVFAAEINFSREFTIFLGELGLLLVNSHLYLANEHFDLNITQFRVVSY